jgi:hypothetical protein
MLVSVKLDADFSKGCADGESALEGDAEHLLEAYEERCVEALADFSPLGEARGVLAT